MPGDTRGMWQRMWDEYLRRMREGDGNALIPKPKKKWTWDDSRNHFAEMSKKHRQMAEGINDPELKQQEYQRARYFYWQARTMGGRTVMLNGRLWWVDETGRPRGIVPEGYGPNDPPHAPGPRMDDNMGFNASAPPTPQAQANVNNAFAKLPIQQPTMG